MLYIVTNQDISRILADKLNDAIVVTVLLTTIQYCGRNGHISTLSLGQASHPLAHKQWKS